MYGWLRGQTHSPELRGVGRQLLSQMEVVVMRQGPDPQPQQCLLHPWTLSPLHASALWRLLSPGECSGLCSWPPLGSLYCSVSTALTPQLLLGCWGVEVSLLCRTPLDARQLSFCKEQDVLSKAQCWVSCGCIQRCPQNPQGTRDYHPGHPGNVCTHYIQNKMHCG